METTIRFGPDDEPGFERARHTLLERYEAALRLTEDTPDLFIASLMLEYRWAYGDGRILQWTADDVETFLLDFLPRKTALDAEAARIAPIQIIGFLGWLATRGELGGDGIDALIDAVDRAEPAFRDAANDAGGLGPAQRLVAAMQRDGVDPTDPRALDRWMADFNARPVEERSAVLGIADDPTDEEDEPLPVIDLPSLEVLADDASESRTHRQLRIVTGFVAERRRVTPSGMLSATDADLLAERLGRAGVGGAKGSALRSPAVERLWRWAILVGFVEVEEGAAVQGYRAELLDESPQEAWLLAFLGLIRGGLLADETDWAADEEPLIDLLLDLPEQLYRLEALTVEQLELVARRLVEGVDSLVEPPRRGRRAPKAERVGRALRGRVLEPLLELGAITVEDDVVELTPLGRWGVMLWLRAKGLDAPVVGDQAGSSAEEILAWCEDRTLPEAREELVQWVAARPGTAADELVEALREGASLPMVLFALSVVGPSAEPVVRTLLDDDELRDPVLVWLVEQGLEDPGSLSTEALMTLLVGSMIEIMDDDGPEAMVEHLRSQGPETEQLRLIENLLGVDHPRATELLQAIGRHHPTRSVAKAARSVAFRRLGLRVH